MAQVIQPEIWQEGIDDNRLLPGRYTTGIFTGSGVKIANNNEACRVWDIQVTDYITDYDDRRINGLLGSPQNGNGNDGWSASAYGVFQDVRFDSRVYTMGRHRSIAMRLFDEMQYGGPIGEWGTATTSNVMTNGQALMKTAQLMNKAKDIWQKQVLGPDIDKYNLFAILNGHISGRWVADNPDVIFDGEGQWVAQPGTVQGQAIQPRFAPIHCIQWDEDNIPLLLQNIKVTWNNLFIPEDNRVILIDPFYEYHLLAALTGKGVPATDSAYSDVQNGSFTKLMGWDFNFDIPSQYWPELYVDANLNVVHSEDGNAPYDQIINSVAYSGDNPDHKLLVELTEADRMNRPNYVRTIWDSTNKIFKKVITNYPLGMPSADPFYGVVKDEIFNDDINIGPYTKIDSSYAPDPSTGSFGTADPYSTGYWNTTGSGSSATDQFTQTQNYPWAGPGAGYGLDQPAGPDKSNQSQGKFPKVRVIGCAVYKPAAQLSQEYSEMRTAEGETRGKFTEMVMDVKYDAWVIERLSHGILPIIEGESAGEFGIPVKVIGSQPIEVTGGTDSQGNAKPVAVTGTGEDGELTAVVSPDTNAVWATREASNDH